MLSFLPDCLGKDLRLRELASSIHQALGSLPSTSYTRHGGSEDPPLSSDSQQITQAIPFLSGCFNASFVFTLRGTVQFSLSLDWFGLAVLSLNPGPPGY